MKSSAGDNTLHLNSVFPNMYGVAEKVIHIHSETVD